MAGVRGELLERAPELDLIRARIEGAAQGHGGLLVIEGPAGIGKTRLLEGARALGIDAGMAVHWARGGVLETAHPLGVASQLLGDVSKRLEATAGPRPAEPDDAEVARFRLLESLCQMVLSAASKVPTLWCVDDAHWADEETLRLLAYLAGRLRDAPVLLGLTIRPQEPAAREEILDLLATDPEATVLRPSPLSGAAIAALVGRRWERRTAEVAAEFVSACADATGGNPFLVAELIRAARDDGLEPTSSGARRIAGFVPAAVSRAVLARIGRLPADARDVASVLAVLGGHAEWGLLAELTDLPRDRLAEITDQLGRAGVLARSEKPEFLHPMIREVVYDDLSPGQRDASHMRVAVLLSGRAPLDPEKAAVHLRRTRPRGEQWAAALLADAGSAALDRGAATVAAEYLRRALAEPPAGERVEQALRLLGEAERLRGEPAEAARALTEALALCGAPTGRAEIVQTLAQALTASGRATQAAAVLVAAIADLPKQSRDLGLKLEATLAVITDLDGGAGASVRGRRPRFTASGAAAKSEGERLALAGRADEQMNRGTAAEAGRLASEALGDGALLREQGPTSVLFYSTAIVLLYSDHLDDAERAYLRALEAAREAKLPGHAAHGFLAGVHHRRGSLREAEEHARAALPAPPVDATQLRAMFACAFLLETLVDRGNSDLARRTLAEVGAEGELPDALVANLLQHARGRVRATHGDHEGALADHLACAQRAADWSMRTPAVCNWHSAAALELAALGRRLQARDQAAAGVRIATDFGSPRAIGIALLADGRVRNDLEQLGRAAEILARSPARLEHARALIALGAGWRRGGERARAREPLREGLRLARVCGAEELAREAFEELAATGARPRKLLRSGTESLTPAELRVARFAADGMRNQEIADALVVSIRTVEAHLAHIYQKLDITSRKQLGATLGQAVA